MADAQQDRPGRKSDVKARPPRSTARPAPAPGAVARRGTCGLAGFLWTALRSAGKETSWPG